jgi:hypothetical protein
VATPDESSTHFETYVSPATPVQERSNFPLVDESLAAARSDGAVGSASHGVVCAAADEHVVPQAFVTRTKHLYPVFPERPVTVYDVAVEMALVIVSTVPAFSVVGSGHDDRTVSSVQNASSSVTVGSVTAVHVRSMVTPPAGATSDGASGAAGAAAQAEVCVTPWDAQVSPQSLTDLTQHV